MLRASGASPFKSHALAILALAKQLFCDSVTRSGSKPNFRWSSLSGADAPNVFMPMTRPDLPT